MIVSMIVAIAKNGCIGKDNELPWPRIAQDMKWFKTHTSDKIVLMGSNTWYSLPKRPLANRINVVISSKSATSFFDGDLGAEPDHVVNGTPEEIITQLRKRYPDHQELMIIGGAQVYNLFANVANRLYVTRIDKEFEGDCFLNLNTTDYQDPFFSHTTKGDDFDITYEIMDKKL
jgi:dihydrofolate reductase